MPYMQRLAIMGVTGSDPEKKVLDTGLVAHFSVCVEEYWRNDNDGKRQSTTTWFRCSAFGRVGEQAMKLLPKGTWIYLEGRMRCRRANDIDYWSVNVDNFRKLTPPKPGSPED